MRASTSNGGFWERDSQWWKVFYPLAYIAVRVPGLRMALAEAGWNSAMRRAEKASSIIP